MRFREMERRRTLLLVLVMAIVAFSIGGISLAVLYQTAFEEARARLTETAHSRARLMESVAAHNIEQYGGHPGKAFEVTLSQVRVAHRRFEGFGESGEFTLAKRDGNQIIFLLRHRHGGLERPGRVSFHQDLGDDHLAEPMRRALSGQSGTVIAPDYRGVTVLAAHEPVSVLHLGVVAKIDLMEIRAPFLRAAVLLLGISILLIVIGAMLVVRISDPMVKKMMESEALRRSQDALMRAQEGLAKAQQIAHLGNWDWHIIDNTLTWSDEIYRIFGMEPQAFGATYEAFMEVVHPLDRKAIRMAVERALDNGDQAYEIGHRIIRPDGVERFVHEKGEVIRNEEGRPIRMVGTVQDITERKQAEEAIRDLNINLERRVEERTRQFEAANRELESFSYSVAHDLRAPLNNAIGFAKILVEDYRERFDQQGRDYLEAMLESTRQMRQRINDYLNLARSSRTSLRIQSVDLSRLMETAAMQAVVTRPAYASVRVDIMPGCMVMGDPDLLRVVAETLIFNAMKFSHQRDEPLVTFHQERTGKGDAMFVVRDNGVGFDPRFADRLFEPFERLHASSAFEGSGIGLTTAQRIIRRHGGSIRAESTPGQGAVLYFTLGDAETE